MSEFSTESERQRLVTWTDPLEIRQALLAMDGAAFASAVREGTFPVSPMMRLIGLRVRGGDDGQLVFEAEPAEYHYNPMAFVHGAFAAAMLDSAIGYNLQARLPKDSTFTTLEIKISYLKAMTTQIGKVHTDTSIVSLGRRVASLESRLLDDEGRVYATASSTCLLVQTAPNS